MNPPSDDLHRQIPLELALALSGNFNLQALLKDFLGIFIQKLHCASAAVIHQTPEGLTPVRVMPEATAQAADLWVRLQCGLGTADAEMALLHEAGHCFMGFPLPDFGSPRRKSCWTACHSLPG